MSENPGVTSWFENNSALFPAELDVLPARKIKVAVLGACIAESLADAFNWGGDAAEHHLARPLNGPFTLDADWRSFEAVVVHTNLRRLINNEVPEADLIHVRTLSDERSRALLEAFKRQLFTFVDSILSQVDNASPVFFLSMIEPPSSYQGILLNNRRNSLYFWVRTLNDELANYLENKPSAYYIEVNDIVRYYGDAELTDAYTAWFTHAAPRGWPGGKRFPELVRKRIHGALDILRAKSPVKLIITDLDNTLWKGVLAENDVEDIVPADFTEGWPIGYVEALLEFKRRGGLLAISSKNDREIVEDRFPRVWKERLRLDDFCSVQVNWDRKSLNIEKILTETNLLPSSVLFIDDNPREIEEVARAFPDIRTLTVPEELWRNVILFSPSTQVASISEESAARTVSIHAKQLRAGLASQVNQETYLESLELKVRINIVDAILNERFARAMELINKTNQFNTTGRRWSVAEFQSLFETGGCVLVASSSDRLENSGLVAAAIVQDGCILQAVMSCRVFGLGVETALLSSSADLIRQERADVRARLQATARNHASATYYGDHGFAPSMDPDIWQISHEIDWPTWIKRV